MVELKDSILLFDRLKNVTVLRQTYTMHFPKVSEINELRNKPLNCMPPFIKRDFASCAFCFVVGKTELISLLQLKCAFFFYFSFKRRWKYETRTGYEFQNKLNMFFFLPKGIIYGFLKLNIKARNFRSKQKD